MCYESRQGQNEDFSDNKTLLKDYLLLCQMLKRNMVLKDTVKQGQLIYRNFCV